MNITGVTRQASSRDRRRRRPRCFREAEQPLPPGELGPSMRAEVEGAFLDSSARPRPLPGASPAATGGWKPPPHCAKTPLQRRLPSPCSTERGRPRLRFPTSLWRNGFQRETRLMGVADGSSSTASGDPDVQRVAERPAS